MLYEALYYSRARLAVHHVEEALASARGPRLLLCARQTPPRTALNCAIVALLDGERRRPDHLPTRTLFGLCELLEFRRVSCVHAPSLDLKCVMLGTVTEP